MDKGRVQITLDGTASIILYRSEVSQLALEERMELDEAEYNRIYHGVLGRRVTLRAMHLLEKRDRTEEQLRRKLKEGAYPEDLIEAAIDYVKSYRYIDDDRYARTYVRLNQERRSSNRMRMDLLAKGVSRDIIDQALAEENETKQEVLIRKLLDKRHYDSRTATPQETQKNYQFLLRRGFCSSDIMHVLRQ